MPRKTLIVVVVFLGVAAILYGVFGVRTPSHAPQETPRPSPPLAASVSASEVPSVKVEHVAVPAVTLPEFRSPYFVSAYPAYQEAVLLRDLDAVKVSFSMPLEGPSQIVVFSNKKRIAVNTEIAKGARFLAATLPTGDFELARVTRGIYEVYYTACFAGEGLPTGEARPQGGCFNGQYAFVGL